VSDEFPLPFGRPPADAPVARTGCGEARRPARERATRIAA